MKTRTNPAKQSASAALSGKRAILRPASAKTKAVKKTASSHILSAPKGPRTLTHRAIEKAVDAVIKARDRAHG